MGQELALPAPSPAHDRNTGGQRLQRPDAEGLACGAKIYGCALYEALGLAVG